ncbi:MAG: HlyD family efflux transporter periplasmic adaptor subunit [Chloroflexi bacterium]|nr:HlyD family efflux transporter periplasmic adaptor subunit [Chloroflexota bacterium]
MKAERIVPIVIIVVIVIGVAVGGIYFATNPDVMSQVMAEMDLAEPEANGLTASGFIEADEVSIAPELGGRVVELLADEGDEIEAGQVLVRLDGTLLDAQAEVAQAALGVAEAGLAQVRAGARAEQIRQAEAGLAQAEIARDGSHQAWQDLIAIRDNPQELEAQIILAQSQVAVAQAALAQTVAYKDAAEIANDAYDDGMKGMAEAKREIQKLPKPYRPNLPVLSLDFHLIPNAYWKSWVGVNTAQAGLDGARVALGNLYDMRDNPQELNAQVDAAKAQHHAAEAAVQMAEAQLDALRAGATEEDIAIVETQVEQARAALDSLDVLREKLVVVAPVGGLVLERSIHAGELAAPGATLLTLGDLGEVMLTVYVPEDKLGHVFVGQEVEVQVDSFPERTFLGSVVAIANEAEFTPRNVQTQEERVNMVFAIEVSIPNPDHALRPGLPADAVIVTEEQ